MARKQPNILFILADQHNAKVLGCKGHPDVKTPHLDCLAQEGVRFENAITQSPICTPSRVSWLSGQYGHNHGFYGLSGPKPKGLPTLLGHFRKAGYKTAAIGKIHCPENWVEDDCDVFHEVCEGHSVGGLSPAFVEFCREIGYDDGVEHRGDPDYSRPGDSRVDGRPGARPFDDTMEGWVAATAVEFMQDATANGGPFFCFAGLPRPHQTTSPAPEFWDLYDPDQLSLPPNAGYDLAAAQKAPHMISTVDYWRHGDWAMFEPKTFEAARLRKLQGYLGAVSQVDHAVGRLVQYLRESRLAENTIVIYSSDHGEYACEHDNMEKAPGICADAITRIPMIWRWPEKFKAGHAAEEIVETVDLANTLCSLAGLDAMETADGKDISHLLKGESGEVRGAGVTEFAWSKSVRKGNYRLVYYPREMFTEEYPGGFGELYDLAADPWEMRNLFFDRQYGDVVRDLQQDLLDWIVTTTRPATVLPPAIETTPQSTLHYSNVVNADGKIHPDFVRRARPGNYI